MLNTTDKNLDNPRYNEVKQFKNGGFFSVKKTADFVSSSKKKKGKKTVIIGTY